MIQFGEIRTQHDSLAANQEDPLLDNFPEDRGIRTFQFLTHPVGPYRNYAKSDLPPRSAKLSDAPH